MESRLFILSSDKDPVEACRIATESARRIESKDLKLLDLIQSLGEYLTDEDKTIRAKAIGYLSAVLGFLDPKTLSRQQVSVISRFFCDRLEDETGLKDTAQGLVALHKAQRFGKDEALLVASALSNVDLQKHPQGTRFVVLTLLDRLMANQRDALKAMGGKFITGLVDLVGGEKDPRNLMVVFSVIKVVLVEFDIVPHVELLFNIVYCYFPITFRPPPDDPYGISAQDLKLRLRDCIASTRYFADHVFSQLIEKLDSTSLSVKPQRDVLQTITACALSYGIRTVSVHSNQLWDAVKFEVLNSTEEYELAGEALSTIRAIAETLSFGLTASPPPASPIARYLSGIVKECLKLLLEPQQKQAKSAGRILSEVATASPVAFSYIVTNALPALLSTYAEAESLSKQIALMENLNLLFQSTLKMYGAWGELTAEPALPNPVGDFTEILFERYSRALMGSHKDEASLRMTALRGLMFMCKVRRLLQENEVGMVVQYLDEVSLGAQEKGEMRELALEGLKDISKLKPNLIMDITFPAFMAQLPDSEEATDPSRHYITTLEALAKLSLERSVFQVLLTRLLNKLDVILQAESGPMYPRAILSTLLYVLRKKPERGKSDTHAYFMRLVPPLLTKTIMPTVGDSEEFRNLRIMADDAVVDVTGRLLNIVVRSLDLEEQTVVADQLFNIFVRGVPSEYIPKTQSDIVASAFRPLQDGGKSGQAGCVILFTYMLAGLRREVEFPTQSLRELLHQSIGLATGSKQPARRMAHLYLIALLSNKWMRRPDDLDLIRQITAPLMDSVFGSMLEPQVSGGTAEGSLQVIFWIAKALYVRGDHFGMEITERVTHLLGNRNYGPTASKGFAVLFGDDEFLTRDNYAIIRPLAKQRVFSFCMPKIVDGFRNADAATKPNYLIALSHILRNVHSTIILPELGTLLPLLLQSLDLPDPGVKSATLETLHITIMESADAVKEHISSLTTRLLNSCTNREQNPPRVRAAALRCLRGFPGAVRSELLLPYRRQVTRSLVVALDDPKRNVRKEAVDCQAKWHSLDVPED